MLPLSKTSYLIFSGDIVLEVNGTPVTSSDVIKPYLPTSGRHVALGYIPAGKQSTKRAKSPVNHSTAEGSRVKRARNLHDKVRRLQDIAIIGPRLSFSKEGQISLVRSRSVSHI